MSLTVSSPLVHTFIAYSALLGLKLLALPALTSFYRKTNGTSTEIERAKRAHANDLENIPIFWFLGALYLTTNPSVWWATSLFRVFTAARVVHTLVYAVLPVPQQPARGLAWFTSFVVNVYMGVQTLLYYLTAL